MFFRLILAAFVTLLPSARAAALNDTCFAPKILGGLGFCGPSACSSISSSLPACDFSSASTAINYADRISKISCRTCTQSTSARCTTSALKSIIVGSGMKAAYCTDTHLVLISDGTPSHAHNLDDVPNPPGSTYPLDAATNKPAAGGSSCVTRGASVLPFFFQIRIPLTFTLLANASNLNNIGAFTDGAADSEKGYMSTESGTYGLPTRGNIGMTVAGQEMYPMFNNRAELTDDSCEVDSCNEHVGGGGGQPHLHGDPFGPWCLYSAANYTSTTAHPLQIGWAKDGPSIYGRYLYTTSLGYSTALDLCGGHTHGEMDYHYHTQALDAVTTRPAKGMASGIAYTYSTVGVHQCYRADISKVLGFWDDNNSVYYKPCCGMTNYYTATGITINGAGTQSTSSPTPSPSPSTGTSSPSPSTTASPSPTTTTASPSPTSSPSSTSSSSSSPSPSPPPPLALPIVKLVRYVFSMDYSTLTNNSTMLVLFTASIIAQVAAAGNISTSYISVLSVKSGSVVADTQISYPAAAYNSAQASAASNSLATTSSSTFSASFLTTYGVSGVSASEQSGDTSSNPVLSTGAIIGIAVGGGVGLILIVALIVFLAMRKRTFAVSPGGQAGNGKGAEAMPA